MSDSSASSTKAPTHKGADAWTHKIPTPVHWVLTVATLGIWFFIWRSPLKLWFWATISGCLLFFSFADWDIWPFGFFFVVPLLYAAEHSESTKQAWWVSLWGGWVANFGGFWWISGLLIDFGQMHWSIALAICLLMNLYQGLSFALLGALFHYLRKKLTLPAVVLAPILWAGIELVIPLIFPYYLGNSQYTFPPMIQIAELLGPLSVSLVLFVANGALYDVLWTFKLSSEEVTAARKKRAFIIAAVAVVVVAANLVYGYVRIDQVNQQMADATKLKIGLVEADIGIWSKENPAKLDNNLLIHQHLSKKLADEDKVDLIVWPESSFQSRYVFASTVKSDNIDELEKSVREYRRWLPYDASYIRPSRAELVDTNAQDILNKTSNPDRFTVQRGFETPVLFGGITFRPLTAEEMATNPPNKKMTRIVDGQPVKTPRNYRVYNTATLVDGKGKVKGMYNKTFLLAFGEYIPFAEYMPWVYDMIPAASEFTPGSTIEVFEMGEHRLGLMICYEDIIPAFGRKVAAKDPHVLINVTNDAWFGKTSEPYLHLALATFRAVETRKWLLRSTNTGVSAFVDATGKIVSQTSIYDAEAIAHDVPMMTGPPTLYVQIGDVVGYAGLLGIFGLLIAARRRKEEEAEA